MCANSSAMDSHTYHSVYYKNNFLLNIKPYNRHFSENGMIIISNMQGQIVRAKKVSNTKTTFDLSDLATGIYQISWSTDTGNYLGQVLVE